jgi:chromosomal replication initiation ATPase DnaA
MKLLIELDTVTLETKLISRQDITEKDIIKEILNYFNVDSANTADGKGEPVVMARHFTMYFLRELFNTSSKDIRSILGYGESNIISKTLNKMNDLLFDQQDLQYVRPYNNLARIFAQFGIIIKPIDTK